MANEGDPGFFSRYTGEPENRGRSMVEIHREKMEKNRKEGGLATLKAVWPQLKEETLVAALERTDWDADKAYKALSMFQVNKGGASGEKKRKKEKSSKKDDKKKKKSRKREASEDSGSESSSDSDSGDSDSDDSGHKKSKKHKDKHKRKKHKKEKRSKSESGAKAEGKQALKAVGDDEYGKFGIVRESDMWNKRPEFILWCDEVKGLNSEILSKWEEKDMFKEYMEDYNTATLPHDKYYNYEGWVLAEKAKANKGKKVVNTEKTTFNDEADRKRELDFQRQNAKAREVQELRRTLKQSGVADDMREQERLRIRMTLAYQTGDLVEARKLQARLEPDQN